MVKYKSNKKKSFLYEGLTSCWSMTLSISRALMCCFLPWSCKYNSKKNVHFKMSALKLNFKVNVEGESAWVLMPSQDDKISHPVFHWFLHKVEALPAGVKLMLVRTFEMQQVADDLKGIIGTYADEYGTRGYREYTLLTPSCVQRCVWVWQT